MASGSPKQLTIANLEKKHEEVSARLEQLNVSVNEGMEEIRSILRAQAQLHSSNGSSNNNDHNNTHRSGQNSYATRISKVDFPRFDRKNLKEWLYKCNQFFSLDGTPEDAKVRLASIHLEGVALQWHVNYMRSKFDLCPPWTEYVMEVTQRFGEVFEDPLCPVSVLLWLKGRRDEYRNFLGLVTSIDLSDNKLLGEIPKDITSLDGLNFLNLSHNQLTGHIPSSIGSMGSLQSIDFSWNELSGEIPQTISNLSFLSMLDLSYNHLKGEIPTGTQIQTFEASNFVNNNLCGPPLPVNCSSQGKNHNHHIDRESDGREVNWFFVSMAFGFVVGFWIVVAPLFIFRSWRHAYYRFLDDIWCKMQSCW